MAIQSLDGDAQTTDHLRGVSFGGYCSSRVIKISLKSFKQWIFSQRSKIYPQVLAECDSLKSYFHVNFLVDCYIFIYLLETFYKIEGHSVWLCQKTKTKTYSAKMRKLSTENQICLTGRTSRSWFSFYTRLSLKNKKKTAPTVCVPSDGM